VAGEAQRLARVVIEPEGARTELLEEVRYVAARRAGDLPAEPAREPAQAKREPRRLPVVR
jgi:hypothetical protein